MCRPRVIYVSSFIMSPKFRPPGHRGSTGVSQTVRHPRMVDGLILFVGFRESFVQEKERKDVIICRPRVLYVPVTEMYIPERLTY